MTTITFTSEVPKPAADVTKAVVLGDGQVQLCPDTGGLIILGPTHDVLPGLGSLLESPGAAPVQLAARRLQTWSTARTEAILVSRRISSIIRRGQTPIVYLDSHIDGQASVPSDRRDFVSQRLGQILVGLADMPSYLAIYGASATPLMLLEGLGTFEDATIGTMPCDLPLMQVRQGAFRNLHVSIAPAGGPFAQVAQLFDWLEARRVPEGACHEINHEAQADNTTLIVE